MSRVSTVRSDLILLVTAVIWGFAFVAQRMGMDHIGPFLFNGIRFALGALTLILVMKVREMWRRGDRETGRPGDRETGRPGDKETWRQGDLETGRPGDKETWRQGDLETGRQGDRETGRSGDKEMRRGVPLGSGLLLGLILFAGAGFQQAGIVTTTAGNAGFITGLYIIFVPVLGIFVGQKAGWNLWSGAALGAIGLYFLSVTEGLTLSQGDFLVLMSAVFWAIHVLYTGWLAPKHSAVELAITQNIICATLSLLTAFIFEEISFSGIYEARYPILYGGILSVGVAYTLQIVGQKKAPPSHAAIIMSLETVFAVVGGVMILSETMTDRKWLGCALMLCGMFLAQIKISQKDRNLLP